MLLTRTGLSSLLVVVVLALAACTAQEPGVSEDEQVTADQQPDESDGGDGGDEEDAGAGETFTFVAVDIDWADTPGELPAGEVTLEIDNQGDILHDLTVEELGDETVAEAEGGETDSGAVELEPGEYTVYCSVPGHREAGMETTVTAAE